MCLKEDNIKRAIKASISIAMLIVILTIVVIVIIKYNVEGEKNMPFKLSKITIISTAEGLEPEENDQNIKWQYRQETKQDTNDVSDNLAS